MWASSKIHFSVVKGNHTLQRHHFIRYLRIQCTNYHPRGHIRRDSTETHQCETIRDDHVPGISKASPTHHVNNSSIDSMDPVVLKYMNVINELRSKASGIERVNQTHFGSIRFDKENTPHSHGVFDKEYGPEPTSTSQTVPTFQLKFHDNGQSEVLKVSAEEQLQYSSSHDGNVDLQEHQNLLNASQEELKVGVEHLKNYHTDSSLIGSEDKPIIHDSTSQNNNYVDECIFGDSLSLSEKHIKPQVEPLQNTNATDSKLCVNESKNLNFIDNAFFKDTLENLAINRQPAINYRDIKLDLENAVLSGEKQPTSEKGKENNGEIIGHDIKRNFEQESNKDTDKKKKPLNKTENNEDSKSAYDYVFKIRQEEHKKQHGLGQQTGDGSNKSFRKILSLLDEKTKSKHTRYEVLKSLKSSILYNDYDIVGLHKPYGIAMHGGTDSKHHILTEYLPELADYLETEALYPVHRLDASTTGVVLLARTPAMADTLKRMFKERQLKKTYWAITKGIPSPVQGIIDIPVAEGIVDGRRRMVLKPDVKGLKSTTSDSKMAITSFKVISKRDSSALVELSPMTGAKHQLRVHLAFGLTCPVLGDHKYSHLTKMAPQALPGDVLDKFKIKQSQVRQLPLFLHCKSIIVPEIMDGRNIAIHSKIPAYFNKALSLLKLNRHQSQLKLDKLIASLP